MKNKSLLVVLVVALVILAFCMGGYIQQQTIKPVVMTMVETIYVDRPVETIIKVPIEVTREVPIEIIKIVEVTKEVPLKIIEFTDEQELEQFLKDDDTDSHIYLRPIRGTTQIDLNGICDYLALQLQSRALEKGLLMSTEIVEKGKDTHMVCSVIMGNKIYFIEPSDDKYWLWGFRQ